jgi:outer membrane protein
MLFHAKRYFLAIIALAISINAMPQQLMSLEDCIQMALERNIGIERQSLQIDLAANNHRTANAAHLPSLEGFYAHNLSSGKTVNYEDYTYINTQYQDGNIGIQGSIPVFSGFGNLYLSRSAKYSILSEEEKKEELKKALTIEVTAAFLQILFAEEMLGVATVKLESNKEQLRMNEGFFEAGRMSKVEVLNMKSQVAQDQVSKIQAKNDVITAYLTLAQLLNMEDETEFRIKKPVNTENLPLLESGPSTIFEYALVNHPGITSSEHLIKTREAELSAMKARFSPSVSINGILYSRYSELGVNQLNPTSPYPYTDQLRDNMYGRASLNVSIPIFSQLQTKSRITQSKILMRDAKLLLDQKKLTVRQDIQKAYSAALNAQAKYEASSEAIMSATELFNLTKEKYKAGLSSAVDFKIAQNQLVQAESIRIQSKYDFIIRSKILDLFLDKPINLN